jgi:hypothetical protein
VHFSNAVDAELRISKRLAERQVRRVKCVSDEGGDQRKTDDERRQRKRGCQRLLADLGEA